MITNGSSENKNFPKEEKMRNLVKTILAVSIALPLAAGEANLEDWRKLLENQETQEETTVINLHKKPSLYSHLYRNLSEEQKAELFEAKKKFMDEGGIVPDMTAACSRWVSISTVVRADMTANQVQEVYFDIDRL